MIDGFLPVFKYSAVSGAIDKVGAAHGNTALLSSSSALDDFVGAYVGNFSIWKRYGPGHFTRGRYVICLSDVVQVVYYGPSYLKLKNINPKSHTHRSGQNGFLPTHYFCNNIRRGKLCQPIIYTSTYVKMNNPPTIAIGYVYRIWSALTNKCYIGSTTNKHPNHRFNKHKKDHKAGKNSCSSRVLFDEVGPENCAVSVLETHLNVTEEFLLRREQHMIETHPNAVNKNRAIKPAKVDIDRKSPERYIARMFYLNGEKEANVPISLDKQRYWLEVGKAKYLPMQKARRDYCDECGEWYNQIKVHYVSEKHKKRVAQLALSPIMAKAILNQ